jgi:GNAT superfamily N-acetyltransferase
LLTGAALHEEHVLDDGTRVVVRHVRPGDAPELKHAYERLSVMSRYRRFLGSVNAMSEETLRYLTCVDGHDHVAIVATTMDPNAHAEIGVGIARFVRLTNDPAVAEAALTVVDDMQRKGIGRILGLTLARAALERGVKRFRGEIIANNEPVRLLLEEVGAVVHRAGDESLVFDVDLGPPESPSASRRFEAVARGVLRAASSHLVGLIRGLGPPSSR